MIERNIQFALPTPWTGNKHFSTEQIGSLNFLVGPNGSGKSRFAKALLPHLPGARLLNTDRLMGMSGGEVLKNWLGDPFQTGYAKNHFSHLKNSGNMGSGLDTIILLEERLDLRIQVEATLSHLFDRQITLAWDSGHLIANASLGTSGTGYRLDQDECHGIKELLVLLTHLYNDQNQALIIDEPELNLHPQYQAFFMQEVRRLAGDPLNEPGKKIIFLVTHSPFILDFHSVEDVKSVISFGRDHCEPRHIFNLSQEDGNRIAGIVPRLNVHHKQLFFSDNPIFVEGILDAQLIETIQQVRGVSIAGAGSCVIDAGGCEEVTHYLRLCGVFNKKAYFLYDLDSLFNGQLRGCIAADGNVKSFLADLGVGGNFSRYCGELDTKAADCAMQILVKAEISSQLTPLKDFLSQFGAPENWTTKQYAKARVAMLTAISRFKDDVINATSPLLVQEIEGRLNQIRQALSQRNVMLLAGGTLERYLPSYVGDPYALADSAKTAAVNAEMTMISVGMSSQQLAARYGLLYEYICALPGKNAVDSSAVLKRYLGGFIHHLQEGIKNNPKWNLEELKAHTALWQTSAMRVFSLKSFERKENEKFIAVIAVVSMLGQPHQEVAVTEQTNGAMQTFQVVPVNAP